MLKLQILSISILIINSFNLFSQKYDNDNLTFYYGDNIKLNLVVYDNSNDDKMYLQITNNKDTIKNVKLSFGNEDPYMIFFGENIIDAKKYIIIKARYSFMLLNLYNYKLSGLYSPLFTGLGSDAQSGMLVGIQAIYNGRFIIGYCVDSGAFLYDFSDFYNGKEVYSVSNPLVSQNRIIILDDFANPDKQFGIFLNANNSWEVSDSLLFFDKKIENKAFDYSKYNYDDIENELQDFSIVEYNYTILKELNSDNTFTNIVFENYSGKKLNLPDAMKIADKNSLIKYLENINR